jgi:CHAT domain-containing protein
VTVTGELLQQLEREFGIGLQREIPHIGSTIAIARPRMERANALNVRGVSTVDALVAARLYGECAAIATVFGAFDLTTDARSRFAQLIAWTAVPNRDEAAQRAAVLFQELGDELEARRDRDRAAMMWMNSGLTILEMRNPSGDELGAARELLDKTLRMRRRNTVDFAYSQMNLAVADLRTLDRRLRRTEHPAAFKEILRALDRSARAFKKHDGPNFRWAYHRGVVDALNKWLELEIERSEDALYATSIPAGFSMPNSVGLSGVELVRVIAKNPRILGLSAVPDWVPTRVEILTDALSRVDSFDRRIADAELYLKRSGKPNHDLRTKLFELEAILTPLRGLPAPPFDAFDAKWHQGLYEEYLIHALGFLSWENSHEYPPDRYSELLLRLFECVRLIRRSWSFADIERLLQRQPTAYRFGACELGRLGLWRDGFRLLEATRGLVSSQTLSDDTVDADEQESAAANVSWVHVTNSPRGTYVFVCRDGVYSGREFAHASGGALAAEFTNLVQGGLLIDQTRNRPEAAASAKRLCALLEPVADWIAQTCGEFVVLHPGGFYQSFPLSSVGQLLTSRLDGRRRVSTTPSRAIALRSFRRGAADALRTVSVQQASSVAGFADLPWSVHEPAAIDALLSPHMVVSSMDATRQSLTEALGSADLVHFTGHSSAVVDPQDSALVTYGEPMTARDILSIPISSPVVVLGSCQSALAMNMHAQDEMLSLQSAMYYAGAELVVGTSWPIRDSAAFVFSVKFFEAVAASGATSSQTLAGLVIGACAAATAWMRKAAVGDVNSAFQYYGAPLIQGSPDPAAAFDFYDWGAFGVVGALMPDD